MTPLPYDAFGPAPADDPLVYPGRAPEGSFLYADGDVWALEDGDALPAAERHLERRGSVGCERRVPILCLGSNACPPQVHRKLSILDGDRTVVFLHARVRGIRAVYAGHVASYGAIPATGDGGGDERLFLALYTADQLAATFESEHGNYDLCTLPEVRAELPDGDGPPIPVWAFLSRWGILTPAGDEAVRLDAAGQTDVVARLLCRCGSRQRVSRADYAAAPGRYKPVLEECLRQEGLRRPPSLVAHSVDVAQVEPLGSLLGRQTG